MKPQSFLLSKIEDLVRLFEKLSKTSSLKIKYLGVDGIDNIHFCHDFNFFVDEIFLCEDNFNGEPDILVVCGPITHELKNEILIEYNNINSDKKILIHISGSLEERILKKSYFFNSSPSDDLPFDFIFKAFPLEIEGFVEKLRELERSK